jgi:hypothetical protein
MSVIGTGIAAGVANTTQTARQAANQRDGEAAQRADNARNADRVTIAQLHGAGATRDSDEDMPDQQAPGYEDLYGQGDGAAQDHEEDADAPPAGDTIDLIHRADAPACSPTGLPLSPTYGPQADAHRAPLFHRLDVTA